MLVNNLIPRSAWDAVVIDNVTGTVLSVEMLTKRGHSHITLIGGPDHPSIVERTNAYVQSMLHNGLPPVVVSADGLDPQDGKAAVGKILREQSATTGDHLLQ